MTTATITIDTILARYATDISFVAEEQPPTNIAQFTEQIETAGDRLTDAGINGAEDFGTAAMYLSDADRADGTERDALLTQANQLLSDTADMVGEYRLMA